MLRVSSIRPRRKPARFGGASTLRPNRVTKLVDAAACCLTVLDCASLPVAHDASGSSSDEQLIMTRKRLDPVVDAIASYGVRGRLSVDDVVLFYTRAEYTTGRKLDEVLDEIDRTLAARGIAEMARRSVLNIVFELSFNSVLHSHASANPTELLVIAVSNGHVSVSMFGDGRTDQVDRLERAIASVRAIATPPDHQAKMLEYRNRDAWRRRKVPDSPSRGGGMGMLTVAALSSEALFFTRKAHNRGERFVLQSVV